jgi:hypothetical protein
MQVQEQEQQEPQRSHNLHKIDESEPFHARVLIGRKAQAICTSLKQSLEQEPEMTGYFQPPIIQAEKFVNPDYQAYLETFNIGWHQK